MRGVSLISACLCLGGCLSSGGPNEIVVYTAHDAEFSEPILHGFTDETKIRVLAKYDIESTKTVGLTQALIAESGRPRCDVFWNNEILNTLRLERQGLLAAYDSPAAAAFPAQFRSPHGTWCGFAARARIILVNTKLVPEAERPASIFDLADAKWKGKIGIAKPLFGTTATQAACLFAVLGDEKARQFFESLKNNEVHILSGNKQVAQSVSSGAILFGLTDTDDAMVEIEQGQSVAIVYPDRQPDQIGTLFIPNTVAIIKGCPHPENAERLVDYLLSPTVEEKLANGPSAQIPLNPSVLVPARVETPATVKPMTVDFHAAADKWDEAAKFLRDEFTGP